MENLAAVNPWLEIPAADYEGHMQQVGQLQLLNELFHKALKSCKPKAPAVLGCSTGNGFEHIDFSCTTRAVGIDVNPEYLELARQRYEKHAAKIEWRCADLEKDYIGEQEFDLIYAALIFEYVDLNVVLPKIHRALRTEGRLHVVLQTPSESFQAVSATPYSSLKKLSPIMKLLTPEQFRSSAIQHSFSEMTSQTYTLSSGKTFFTGFYRPIG